MVGDSYGICQKILTENLNMYYPAAKFLQQLLILDEEKKRHMNYCAYTFQKGIFKRG